MHNKQIQGIIVPMVTPLTTAGQIDRDSTRRLIDFLINGGVHGLFLLGSAGEGPLIPQSMQREFVEIAMEHTAAKVPIVVGISDVSTAKCLSNLKNLNGLPIDAFVSTLPFYFNTVGDQQFKHFAALAKESPAPLMPYDLPMRVKDKIELEVVLQLANTPNILGLKDTSGDLATLRRILDEVATKSDFKVFIGDTTLMDVAIYLGAAGAVSADANVRPESCVAVYEAAQRGDWDTARLKQKQVNLERLAMGAKKAKGVSLAPQSLKYELVEKGILATGTVMLPY